MTKLPHARLGVELRVRNVPVPFSYYPMRRGNRRWGLHTMVYTADPWAIIQASLPSQCTGAERLAAESFVRQAREFFLAAGQASAFESKPLLYYYGLLNLGKAFSIARGRPGMVGSVHHGLKGPNAGPPLQGSVSVVLPQNMASAFHELYHALTSSPLAPGVVSFPLDQLMAQSVVGHRMWIQAGNHRERFISLDSIRLVEDRVSREVWSVLELKRHRRLGLGRSLSEVLKSAGLDGTYRVIESVTRDGETVDRFEQAQPVTYTHRASDELMKVVGAARPRLWPTVTSTAPYRKYYLYLSPAGEVRLPPLLSIYALFFALGTLTRYRPQELLTLVGGPYGTFIRELMETQPSQFLYSIASEFAQQELTRAAVV